MPELPEIRAVADELRGFMMGATITRMNVTAISVLKTTSPAYDAVVGETVIGVRTRGKYLVVSTDTLDVVLYLARAGWLRWKVPAPARPPAMGRGPLALRVVFARPGDESAEPAALELTEQGTKKSVAAWITVDADSLEPLSRLGPEADELDLPALAQLLSSTSSHVKTVLTDQRHIAGIGNAWSDEILYLARLSPFARASGLVAEQVSALHTALREVLDDCTRAFSGVPLDRLKAKKKSLLRVHGRTGEPCAKCGTPIAQVAFADRSLQYCPGCQTGGKRLSDRRMDRLLK